MATFTIDSDNNIVAHAAAPPKADHLQPFSNEKELATIAKDWPSSRLVKIWNSFAGVAPFDDLKPVKKFTSRQAAVRRIWEAIARLAPIVAPSPTNAKKRPPKKPSATPASNKKAQVIALMRRPKGATLAAIVEATGWQKHTVRGFVSILGSKSGMKIESSKTSSGERSYRIAK